MSKYRLYKSYCEKIGKLAKLILLKRGINVFSQFCEQVWQLCPEKSIKLLDENDAFTIGSEIGFACKQATTQDQRIIVVEKIARKNGNMTLFINDDDLIETLYKSNIRVDKSALMAEGPKPFTLSVPSGISLDGVDIQPFLFMVDGGCFPGLTKGTDNQQNVGCVLGLEDVEDPHGERLHSCCSYNDVLNGFQLFAEKTKWDKVFTVHIKIGYALFCYMRAFPECVVPGIPSDMSIKEMMHGGPKNKRTGFTIKAPIDTATGRALHLRRGHFRSLHDERFKRNDDGSIKIVWVRESVVGGKIDPYTVEAHAV